MRRLRTAEVPVVREALIKRQAGKCPLCTKKIEGIACLDHCHTHGHIRGALCRNCNGIEGKIGRLVLRARRDLSAVDYLRRLADYLELHSTAQYGLLHPTHKDAEEKRVARNERARKKRAAAKKQKVKK